MPRRRRDVGRDLRQRLAGAQAARALDMHREVAVAQAEPVGAAHRGDGRHERPGLVAPAPALLGVVEAGQHVGQRVDVGRDLQAEMLEIVAGVGDDQKLVGRQHAAQAQAPAWPRRHRRTGRRPVPCSPEQVLGGGPHQLGGRVVGRRPGEAAHQDDRLRLVALALHERGGGGDLVGEARDADLQGAAEQVGIAAQVEQGRQARGADRDALRCRAATPGRSCR